VSHGFVLSAVQIDRLLDKIRRFFDCISYVKMMIVMN